MANGTQTVSAVITADAKPFKKAVGDAGKSFDGFSTAAKNFGIAAGVAIGAATAALGGFLAKSVTAAADAEAIARGLENAAENAGVFASQAGGIAGATEALKNYATQLGETIGIDDEKILGIVSQWLAVPDLASLGVDGLNNLVTVAADVAAGTNKDLDSIASSFVKVAGDGETALSKLLRQGIVFTDEQKATYQSLLDSNDEIGAQTYLIEQLGIKYDGAAEAIADPFDRLKVIFDNFSEEIGAKFLPIIEDVIPIVQEFLDELLADPEFAKFVEDLVEQFTLLLPEILDLLPILLTLGQTVIPLLIDLLPVLTDALDYLATLFQSTSDETDNNAASLEGLAEFIGVVIGGLQDLTEWLENQREALDRGEPSIFAAISIIGALSTAFNLVSTEIQEVITWWNNLWGIQNSKPLSVVGSADMLDRTLNPQRVSYGDDRMANKSTYNISVNAIAPTAEVGRAVVDSLKQYRRVGGVF